MARTQRASNEVLVRLPKESLTDPPAPAEELAQELRVLWLIEKVRRRQMGYGKAAELAGVPVASFLKKMGEHAVSPWNYEPGEVTRQVQALEDILGSSSPTPVP